MRRKARETSRQSISIEGDLKREVERVNRESSYLFGIAMGLAGVGASLGLASDLYRWIGVMWHPSNYCLLIMGLSLAVLCWYLLKYRGYYQRRKKYYYWATGIGIAGSIGVAVSYGLGDYSGICWLMWVSVGFYVLGVMTGIALCAVPIRARQGQMW